MIFSPLGVNYSAVVAEVITSYLIGYPGILAPVKLLRTNQVPPVAVSTPSLTL